jgi:hypothetical protein
VDTVAERYALRPVSIQEYFTLAELGEALLFVVRLVHRQAGGIGNVDDGAFRAFLDVIEDWVQRYVAAYATVTGIAPRPRARRSCLSPLPPTSRLATRRPPSAHSGMSGRSRYLPFVDSAQTPEEGQLPCL